MSDLNVALILRFIDQATGPARAALRNVQGAAERVERFGTAQVAAGRQQVALAGLQMSALRGQALALTAVGYAAYRALGPSVAFEAQMSRVGAVARASAGEQERLTATARELGRSTAFTAVQAAQGMEYLARAGFDTNQTIAAMPGLLNLAAAAGSDLGTTSEISATILRGFNMQADQTGRLGDVLVNAFTSSNTTLESLGATMSYVAPAASAAGLGLEQTAAMAAVLGNNAQVGERAGTALRAMLARLAAPSNEAAAALEQLNVQVSDDQGNLRDIPTVLAEMDRAMQGMGSATRQELLTTIFGVEASTAALILTSEAGSGALQAYADRLHESGTAAETAARMNDNAQGALRRLQSAAQDAQIALGNGLLPVLADLADRMIPLLNAAGTWLEANKGLVETFGWITAGLLSMNAATLATRGAFWLLFGWVGKVRIVFGILAQFLGTFTLSAVTAAITEFSVVSAGGLSALGEAIVGVAAAVAGISAPVWAAIAAGALAVAAAGYSVWKYWDRLSAIFSGVARRIGEELRPALDWLSDAAQPILDAFAPVVAWMSSTFAPVIAAFSTGWQTARTAVEDFGNWMGSFFQREVLTDDQRAAFEQAGYDFTDRLLTGIRSGLAPLVEAGSAMIQSLWDGAVARFEAFLEWVRGIPGRVVAAIGQIDLSGAISGLPGDIPSAPAADPSFADRAAAAGWVGRPDGSRATGGPVRPGFWYNVNENGIESIMPLTPMRVIPAGESRRLMASAGGAAQGGGLQVGDINIHAAPGMDAMAIAREVRRQIEDLAREARFALHDGGLHA